MNIQNVSFAYIGPIPDAIFQKLKEERAVDARFRNSKEEYDFFEKGFLASYQGRNPHNPPSIPAWRQFTRYGDSYFLHPYASETVFPPKKGLLRSIRSAAEECCDVELKNDGTVTTVNISPIAAIYNDGRSLVIQGICDDQAVMSNPSISTGCQNPFRLNIRKPAELVPFFRDARKRAGDNVMRLLQRPPYFPGVRG
jgi:hypothetical protein